MSIYTSLEDGSSHHTQDLASLAWVVYSHDGKLLTSIGLFLGRVMNNVVEYHSVTSLLIEASSLGISFMVVRLYSQLVVSQLNHVYDIRKHGLL